MDLNVKFLVYLIGHFRMRYHYFVCTKKTIQMNKLKKTMERWFEDFKKTCEKDPETLLIERTGRGEGHGKGEGEIVA